MVIDTVDPRGFKITCDSGTWNKHIETGHTIMQGNKNAVKETIENPEVIYQSDQSPVRNVYFSKVNSSPFPHLYTKVVVEIDEINETGEVVSAWPQKYISGGIVQEGIIYVKSKL